MRDETVGGGAVRVEQTDVEIRQEKTDVLVRQKRADGSGCQEKADVRVRGGWSEGTWVYWGSRRRRVETLSRRRCEAGHKTKVESQQTNKDW